MHIISFMLPAVQRMDEINKKAAVNNEKGIGGMEIIKFTDVSKSYGKEKIIKDATFAVSEGSICGFVGMNGAGKTTIMKLLLSIIQPDAGSISVMGQSCPDLEKIGAMIGGPSFYGEQSAYSNMVTASLMKFKKVDNDEINRILKLVKLDQTGNKKAKKFSMGMKQRLSIAVSLLGNPKLLIWDEPLNGLDPDGIWEIRELIKKLNEESGVAFFISSHILSELALLVNEIVVINQGTVLFSGKEQDLLDKYDAGSLEEAYMKCIRGGGR